MNRVSKILLIATLLFPLLGMAKPRNERYSEWMVRSEMQRTPLSYYLDFTDPQKRPKGKWSYVMGIELEGMLDTYLAYGDTAILRYVASYPEKMIATDGTVTGYKLEDYSLDNVRTAHFIYRINQLMPRTGNQAALRTLFRQLEEQPRTQDGVWWHKAIYAHQVWLDGIFMGLPFYCQAAKSMKEVNGKIADSGKMADSGKTVDKGEEAIKAIYDDAVDQITRTFHRTFDARTELWKHAWDETHSIFWANPETGLSQHTWARALGWFTMAMVEVLDALPADYARRGEVIKMLQQAMHSVMRYQDSKTGVWYDVLDVKAKENYLESTASCMFAYCLLKGSRLGYLDKSFRKAGEKAYRGILRHFIRKNEDGTLSLTNCCSVSGLGPANNPKRDGSFAYYMSEPIRDNDAKGIGPFIWASLEMERGN